MQGHWFPFASQSSKHLFENAELWLGLGDGARSQWLRARSSALAFQGSLGLSWEEETFVFMCFRTGVRDTDWSLIKILIPTLPASLPSQQPTLLFVDLVVLPLRHRVASKILANEPKASICSPGVSWALPSVCFSRYLSAAARYLSRQGAVGRGGQKIESSTEKVISPPHKGLPWCFCLPGS